MPGFLKTQSLHRSAALSVEDVCCRPADCTCGPEEVSPAPTLAFVRSGAFVVYTGSYKFVAGAGHILYFNGNAPYRVSHPLGLGDDCTALTPHGSVLEEIVRDIRPVCREPYEAPFPVMRRMCDARVAMLVRQFRRSIRAECADPLAAEEIGFGLLVAAVRAAYQVDTDVSFGQGTHTRRAHSDLVHETELFLLGKLSDGPTLSDVARAVGASPYHLLRVFRALTGLPVHRYLNRLRLRVGLDRLIEGAGDLTALALELGYSSHSHFTDAFRAEFGLPPSHARRGFSVSRLREMSKNLEV